MNSKKSVISVIIILFIIFSTVGLAFAGGGNGSGGGTGNGSGSGNSGGNASGNSANITPNAKATISITLDKEIANVGDTVTATIVLSNTGNVNFSNIEVSVITSNGLRYLSYVLSTENNQGNNIYNPDSGLWQMKGLKTSAGSGTGVKTLTVTYEVLPEAAGKNLTATAKYIQINQNTTNPDPNFIIPGSVSANLFIKKNTTETGDNNSTGAENGNNSSGSTVQDKKNALAKAINATKSENGLTALQNLDNPSDEDSNNNPSDKGKSYEVSNSTNQNTSSSANTLYTILGILGVAALVGFGYFKGVRK